MLPTVSLRTVDDAYYAAESVLNQRRRRRRIVRTIRDEGVREGVFGDEKEAKREEMMLLGSDKNRSSIIE